MPAPVEFASLRGGMNNTDPPSALQDDQCVIAENVEFFASALGEKRLGTTNVTLGSINGTLKCAPFLFRHLPSGDETAAELWALYTPTDGSQAYDLQRKTTVWSSVTPSPNDGIDTTVGRNYGLTAASIHGKMFLTYRSVGGADRLHCWDGTTWRRAGLVAPVAAPVVADTGVGTFAGQRFYRVRFTVQVAGVTVRRSEPTTATTFAPSGLGLSARVTKPAASSPSEGETHWELEASTNNADFYRIATTIVGTTTFDDSISAYTVGYAATGVLSEDVGDYTLPWSPKFVVVDEDRILIGGAWENATYASTIGWTPVTQDPGVANDERIPIDTNNLKDLDGRDGGELTGLSRSINGYLYAFKLGRIYKGSRTGQRDNAYAWICITTARGALPGSVVEGVDQSGNPCLYFLDPKVGPCRIGASGVQTCGFDIQTTFNTVNLSATKVAHGICYPNKHQVRWWVATAGALLPNKMLLLHVNNQRDFADGARKGWAVWSEGDSVSALSSCLFSSNIDSNTTRSLDLVPFVGVTESGGDRNLIQRCDTGSLDRGASYTAYVRSKPSFSGGLLTKFGSMIGMVLAKAASGVVISLKVIRDFGIESKQVDGISLTPTAANEDQVIRLVDNLSQSEMYAMQVEFGDLATDSGLWEVNSIVIKERDEEAP